MIQPFLERNPNMLEIMRNQKPTYAMMKILNVASFTLDSLVNKLQQALF